MLMNWIIIASAIEDTEDVESFIFKSMHCEYVPSIVTIAVGALGYGA